MTSPAVAALFALFLWWFSTGVVLYAVWLPRKAERWTLAAATVILLAAMAGLWVSSTDASVGGAYLAFTCALLVWGWHETTFLLGSITGPRPAPCPQGASEWQRFVAATQAILYHELAIAVTGIAIVAMTWGSDNQVGTLTYLLLWIMRLSAKLNIFLGVPKINEQFLPGHLDYLKSYFRRSPMNALFPLSVTAGTLVTAALTVAALEPDATPFAAVGAGFLAALLALAVLEHWLLVVPLPDAALWTWALRGGDNTDKHIRETQAGTRAKGSDLPETGGSIRREPSSFTAVVAGAAG